MALKRKLCKLSITILAFTVSAFLAISFVFASPISSNSVNLSTPYGTMIGEVSADVDNSLWSASTDVPNPAPVIYVKGDCRNYDTGSLIDTDVSTRYNYDDASIYGGCNNNYRVTVYGTHEVRSQTSYVKYNVVTQLM